MTTGTTDNRIQKYAKWWVPILIVLLIRIISSFPLTVEKYYSNGIYPPLARVFRWVLGWLPFSAGDLLYGWIGLWLIIKTYRLLRNIIKRTITLAYLGRKTAKMIRVALWIYIIFNVCWGLNYNRPGIAAQLDIRIEKYTKEDLDSINALLLEKVNETRALLGSGPIVTPDNKTMFKEVVESYRLAGQRWPFMQYHPVALKSSLWGWLGNYTGFTGYYNPFSGEAQVNTTIPGFLLPFTSCHEVGHQLGYARENEANFAGYLAATSSPNRLFRYSAYLEVFLYANRNLMMADTAAGAGYRRRLSPDAQEDLAIWRKFNLQHRNPFEPVIRWLYGLYLRSNQQPEGLMSYDYVTAFIIAWKKKTGSL
jgi:hypothetical protein